MSDTQVKTLVFNTRSRENGGDIFRLLERPQLCMVQNSNVFFLQFNQTIFDNETKKLQGLWCTEILPFLVFYRVVFNCILMEHLEFVHLNFINV